MPPLQWDAVLPEPFVYVSPDPAGPWNLLQKPFGAAGRDTAGRTYQQAREAIEQGRYEAALPLLDRVIEAKGAQVDAAMYWKAYSQARVARRTDALTTLAELQKQFAKSRWINDARALEVEIRQASGQAVPADAQADEEIKLLALRGLMQNDADAALPAIEKILTGASSPRVKDQALFVLSHSSSPKARMMIADIAQGKGNPEVQLKAIRYLGIMSGPENRKVLDQVYRSTADESVKRAILRSFMQAGDRERLLALVKAEPSEALRGEAVQWLAALGGPADLEEMYRSESSSLVRRRIVDGLFMQGNVKALIALARAEKDQAMKKAIVEKLAHMQSPEAREYMLELLK